MNKSLHKLLPVLFGFFVMGFCDVVGISTSYVQQDFGLSETLAGFIPSMVFIWFLLLSIPAALAMNRLGRKNMVQISNGITAVGMLIPFVHYNLATCMTAFVLLGIGNTILQVSLNPLLTNVVKGDALTSSLTAGQVVKAVSSFCGPFIAAFAAGTLGNWQYLFPIFALITLLSAAWLMCTPIREEAEAPQASPVGATFALLKDRTVLLLFLGIVFVVGVDVGMNTVAPKLLIERGGYPVEQAGLGSSVYFVCRTVGALIGSILLVRMNLRGHRRHGRPLLRTGYRGNAGAGRTDRLRLLEHLLGDLLDGAEMPSGKSQRDFGADDHRGLRRRRHPAPDGLHDRPPGQPDRFAAGHFGLYALPGRLRPRPAQVRREIDGRHAPHVYTLNRKPYNPKAAATAAGKHQR